MVLNVNKSNIRFLFNKPVFGDHTLNKNMKFSFLFPAFLLIIILAWCGCGTATVKKDVSSSVFTCDKKADDALKNKSYEKSIILHEFFIKENPDNGLAMYHLGYSYGQLGDHENEIKYYEEAIKKGYYSPGIFFNLGMAYGEMERFDDAMKMFGKAIELNPEDVDAIYNLGTLYLENGQEEKAKEQLEKLMKIDPDGEMTLKLKDELDNRK